MAGQQVVIERERYEELLEREELLLALMGAGVDNWEGYEFAQEALREGAG